ncbi:hypothetical protein GGI09_008331, partial [Coemansia sp. S100]
MQFAADYVYSDSDLIVVSYIVGDSTSRSTYAVKRNLVPNLDALLKVEERGVINYDKVVSIRNATRSLYDAKF